MPIDSGVFSGGGGSSQAILGTSGLRSPLWGQPGESYPEFAFLDLAYDEGYRVIDTAAIYGLGASEKTLGRWMQLRNNREQLAIISKGGHPSILRPGRHRLTVESLDHDLRASLQRLRTDYIDLYLLHRDDPRCDVAAILQYLHEQRGRGTIRAIGASNWSHTRIQEANALARRLGVSEWSVSSPQLSLLSWTRAPWRGCVSVSGGQGAAARAWYQEAGLPLLAWSPFGGGVSATPGAGWTPSGACYRDPGNTTRLARAAVVAQARGITVPQVLIAYLASLPGLVHPVFASRNRDHLRANRQALDVKLSEAELNLLETE